MSAPTPAESRRGGREESSETDALLAEHAQATSSSEKGDKGGSARLAGFVGFASGMGALVAGAFITR